MGSLYDNGSMALTALALTVPFLIMSYRGRLNWVRLYGGSAAPKDIILRITLINTMIAIGFAALLTFNAMQTGGDLTLWHFGHPVDSLLVYIFASSVVGFCCVHRYFVSKDKIKNDGAR